MTPLNLLLTLLRLTRKRRPSDTVPVKRTDGTYSLGAGVTTGYDISRPAARLAPALRRGKASARADTRRDRVATMKFATIDCPNCGSPVDHPEQDRCEECSFHLEVYEGRQEAMQAFRRHLAEPDTIVTDPVPVPHIGWALSHTRLMLV